MMKKHPFFTTVAAVLVAWSTIAPAWSRDAIKSPADLKALEQQVQQVATKVLPATVALVSPKTGASGSGIITTADGLILTAAHVIQGIDELEVVFPSGKKVTGKVLGANFSKDIGMVKIESPGTWPFVERGESRKLAAGDWVIAMGHSAGFDINRTPPVRFGRVVSKGPGNFFTSDSTLIGGDSGGPIFDLKGRIIGVNSSIGNSLNNNNHAGIDGFKDDWDRLLTGETWGELTMNPFANPDSPMLGINMGRDNPSRTGVPVEAITAKSPAANAGVRVGDEVVSIDSSKVTNGRDLLLILAKHLPGDKIKLGILRDTARLELEVTLAKRETIYNKRSLGSVGDDFFDENRAVPLLLPEENEALAKQFAELFSTLEPEVAPLGKSTVYVAVDGANGGKPLAYGTVIGDGKQVLTKWSQIAANRNGTIRVGDQSGVIRTATITGVHEDDDLAVLAIDGPPLTPVKWTTQAPPPIGTFLIAARSDSKVASFGVVSVAKRSLRESSQAFLGIGSDITFPGPGAKVDSIEPKTGAATAGLLKGDLILKIGDRALANFAELQEIMLEKKPGDKIALQISRDGKPLKIEVPLGNFPLMPQPFNPRLRQMERMGGKVSRFSSAFPSVIQTDMHIEPEQCGGPVTDLNGNVIGITIARADRTRSFIIPASRILAIMQQPGVAAANARVGPAPLEGPQLALQGPGQGGPGGPQSPQPRMIPRSEARRIESTRRHVKDMERLIERLHDERDLLERER